MWRMVTRADLTAALSEPEIRAFGQNEDADEAAVDRLVANAVSAVRGYVRSGRRCRMPDDEGLLPDMLVAPAMDLAAFNLLKRFNRTPNEARTKAYERALALFDRLAAGAVVPEDYGETPGRDTIAYPSFRKRPRLLGRRLEGGL